MMIDYSRGSDFTNLNPALDELLYIIELNSNIISTMDHKDKKDIFQFEKLTPSRYEYFLWWISLAYFSGKEKSYFMKSFNLMDLEGKDRFLDILKIKITGVDQEKSNTLLYPDIYGPLLDVIEGDGIVPSKAIKEYLDTWFDYMINKNILSDRLDDNSEYAGYWCFEASLVSRLFKVDEGDFKNHKYYPL